MAKNSSFTPKNDYVFKRIFGHVGNEEITKGLLNSILDTKVEKVDLDKNTIIEQDLYDDKIGILDIKAELNDGISCDIEMQFSTQQDLEKRLLFYWSKMYCHNIKKGHFYYELKRCIAIILVNFKIDNLKEIPIGHTSWQITEKKFYKKILTNVLELHILELPKLEMHLSSRKNQQELLKWIKFIKNPNELEVFEMENNEALKKAKEEYDEISQDEHEQYLADLRMKYILDKNTNEYYAEERGMKNGIEKGKKENKLEIAKKMLDKNMSIAEIIELTELTKEEIEKLKE